MPVWVLSIIRFLFEFYIPPKLILVFINCVFKYLFFTDLLHVHSGATHAFVTWKCVFICSPWRKTREKCPVNWKWNPRSLFEITGNISFSANSFGIRSTSENMWYVNKSRGLILWPKYVITFCNCTPKKRLFHKCCRWHSWSVLWSASAIWIWRISARVQLLVSRRLCGQRKAVTWDNLSSSCIQDQISREFLFAQGQSRMCKHQ